MASEGSENLLEKDQQIKIEIKSKQETENTEEYSDDEESDCGCNEITYGIADAVFAAAVVAPHVVSVWRGTWGIMEIYSQHFPYPQQYLLGVIVHISFALVRSQLLSRSSGIYRKTNSPILWLRERILSKIYTYIFALACIMHWRGGWGLLDMTVAWMVPDDADPHRPVAYLVITITLYLAISCLRASRNLLAPPYFVFTDGKEPTYMFSTRFQTDDIRRTF